jgi:RNA polymerase sigma-32 factor
VEADANRLVRRWQCYRDEEALDALVRAQMKHVETLAKRYSKYSGATSYDDLLGAGAEGLLVGINRFDPNRGVKLVTYASHWVKAKMFERVLEDWRHGKTRHPGSRSGVFWKLRRDRARLRAQGYTPQQIIPILSQATRISEDAIRTILATYDESVDVSLEAPNPIRSEDRTLGDVLADTSPSPYDMVVYGEDAQVACLKTEKALARLDARERFIIEQRYMKSYGGMPSLAELGRRLGISRERVRQIEVRAFKKMRRALGAKAVPKARPKVSPQVTVHEPACKESVRAPPVRAAQPPASPPMKHKLNKLLARMKRKSSYYVR